MTFQIRMKIFWLGDQLQMFWSLVIAATFFWVKAVASERLILGSVSSLHCVSVRMLYSTVPEHTGFIHSARLATQKCFRKVEDPEPFFHPVFLLSSSVFFWFFFLLLNVHFMSISEMRTGDADPFAVTAGIRR